MKTEITFEDYLKKGNLSGNTIESYLWTVNYFTTNYEKVSKENLLAYKGYLMEHFKPKTVKSMVGNKLIPFKYQKGLLHFNLDEIKEYEAILIE